MHRSMTPRTPPPLLCFGTAVATGAGQTSAAPAPQALAAENAMLRLALERLPHGLCMFDGQDRLLLVNRRYREIWDLPAHLARPGTPFADIMAGTRGSETEQSRAAPQPQAGSEGTRRREWRMEDGRTIEIVVTRMPDGGCVAVHEDVTEQRRSSEKIAYLARHDVLTGLPNRSVLREDLAQRLAGVSRGQALAVLCVDLDGFKAVNDTFGHAAGDALLRAVAQRMRDITRAGDLVVRLGGDEFALVQCGTPQPDSAAALGQRLVDTLSQPFEIGGNHIHIGASVGVALAPADGNDAETLLKNADLAMYRAKSEGRNGVRYFEPDMDALAQQRRALECDLRQALVLGQMHLAYQPQLSLDGQHVTGVEALLRWQHPTLGAIPPDRFISVAEESGLIVPIGRWVLSQACRDAVQWPAPVRVAVNVSAVQFVRGSLLHDVTLALAQSGLPAVRLEIEITESVMMADNPQTLAVLRELQSRGVQVAMDDFGTGYSSLSYLRSFRFDRIKIDRSFVRDLETSAEARSIVRAVAGLGRNLEMATTIEGVETQGQLDIARREGCSDVQGFLFSKPRPASEIAAFIQAHGHAPAQADN